MKRILPLACLVLCACSTPPPREQVAGLLRELGGSTQRLDLDAFLAHVQDPEHREAIAESLAPDFARLHRVPRAHYVLDAIEEGPTSGTWWVTTHYNRYAETRDGGLHYEQGRVLLEVEELDAGTIGLRRRWAEDLYQVESDQPGFVERSAEVGLAGHHTPHTPYGDQVLMRPGLFSGAGASAGDYDQDGDLDLVVGDGARARVLRNDSGQFTDVTDELAVGELNLVRGAYWLDYDGDGWLDLLFTRVKLAPVLLRNERGTGFADASALLGDLPLVQYESAAFADVDGDDDLDIYLVVYGDFEKSSWAYPLYDATDGEPDVFLRNDGPAGFVRVEVDWIPRGWGLAAAFGDYDDDGDPDLYTVNDFGVNHLLRNDGDWTFTDVTREAGVLDQGFGMSAAFGDPDADGDLDLYVANMGSGSRWVFEDPDFPLPWVADLFLREFVRQEMYKVTRGNSLLLNQGDGSFVQAAADLGVERAEWAWGANFWDYDNDGDQDIYCPNGYITGTDGPDE